MDSPIEIEIYLAAATLKAFLGSDERARVREALKVVGWTGILRYRDALEFENNQYEIYAVSSAGRRTLVVGGSTLAPLGAFLGGAIARLISLGVKGHGLLKSDSNAGPIGG